MTTASSFSPSLNLDDIYNSITDAGKKAFIGVGSCIQKFSYHCTQIKDNPNAHAHFWKALPAALIALSVSDKSMLHTTVGRSVMFLDGMQFVGEFSDFIDGMWSKTSWKDLAGRVCFFISNLGTTAVWGQELGIFSATTGIAASFGAMASGGAAAGYLCGAFGAVYSLATLADHKFQLQITVKAILDLIACTAGVALTTIALVGATVSPVGIALLVITSSGFGISSFCYANSNQEAFVEPKTNDVNPPIGFFRYVSKFFNNVEGLEKVAKLYSKIAEGTSSVIGAAFATYAKSFAETHEVMNIAKRTYEWTTPVNGEFFWQKSTTSIWKVASKVFLTILSFISLTAFAIKYKFCELAAIASATVGGVAVLSLAAPACVTAFSGFSLIDNAIAIKNEYSSEGNKKVWTKAQAKLNKWLDIQKKLNLDYKEAITSVRSSFDKHSYKLASRQERREFSALSLQEFTQLKVNRLKVRFDNASIRCNKFGINIFNDFTKSTSCSLGIAAMLAVAAGTAAPGLVLGASAFAVTSGFVGFAKFAYDQTQNERKPEPTVNVAPAAIRLPVSAT